MNYYDARLAARDGEFGAELRNVTMSTPDDIARQMAEMRRTLHRQRDLLRDAHELVCSMSCPSVWPTGQDKPHSDLCRRISEQLDGERP